MQRETRGGVGEARGGPRLASAAGWMEFTGCEEACGPDPEPEPCASISNAPAFALVPRSITHHSRACPGVTSQRGTPGTAASPSSSPSPLPCAFPGSQLGPHSLCLPWPAAGQGRSAGSASEGRARARGGAGSADPSPLLGSGAQPVPGGGALKPVWNFYPTRQSQAGAGAVGSGSRPGGDVDAACGLAATRGL